MKLMRMLCLPVAVTLCALASPSFAQTNTLQEVRQAKKIRVAIDLGVPPSGMKNEKLEMVGSDVETAQLLAKDLGVELEVVPTTGPNRIPFLTTNKADIIIATLAITPERQKVIDYSVPYAGADSVIGAPKSIEIKSLADLAGKKVAVTRGTTNDTAITQKAPPGTEIARFDDEATTMLAIVSNQLDIIAQAPALIKTIQERNPSKDMEIKFPYQTQFYGIGLRKGNEPLKAWLDQWIVANLKNGKLNDIYKKYHGADLPADVMKAAQ